MATIVELPVESFEGIVDPDWCPGCGDFGVLKAVKMGAAKAGVAPKDMVLVSGIGCSSNLPGYVHSLRRPFLAWARHRGSHRDQARQYGSQGGHYRRRWRRLRHRHRPLHPCHAAQPRSHLRGHGQPDLRPHHRPGLSHHDERASAPSPRRTATSSSPSIRSPWPWSPEPPSSRAAFSGEPNHMADLIAAGIQHKGFALIDAFSPCVTYNKLNTYAYFKKRVYKLEDEKGYDSSATSAPPWSASHEWGDRIPIGVLYQGRAAHLRIQRAGAPQRPRRAPEHAHRQRRIRQPHYRIDVADRGGLPRFGVYSENFIPKQKGRLLPALLLFLAVFGCRLGSYS